MLHKLQNDVFLFSGMKTYAQLKEASLLLTDANNHIKNFQQFSNDIHKINATYNENYLRAEHQHAVAAVQSAAQYHQYMQDADRYNLQIRTAGDDHVRASHAALNNITLPASDSFWKKNWTPFDWGCRCRIIQVLKSKYDVTDIDVADKAAEKAIGELFKYNPGYQQVIFPPKHPYYKTSKQALEVVKSMEGKTSSHAERKAKEKEIKEWAKQNIPETGLHLTPHNFKTKKLYVSRAAIKSVVSHLTDPRLKEVTKSLIEKIHEYELIGSAELDTKTPNYQAKKAAGVTKFHYYKFEWNGYTMRLNTEEINELFEKPYSINIIKKED